MFGRYLANYAFGYVTMYAGLASAMVALIFLYICASIFIYGGELNSVIAIARERKRAAASRSPTTNQAASRLDHVLEAPQAGRAAR